MAAAVAGPARSTDDRITLGYGSVTNAPTTIAFLIMTLLSLAACVLMVIRLYQPGRRQSLRKAQYSLVGLCTLLAIVLFIYRLAFVHDGWQPLQAHEDGLLLMAALLSSTVLFLQAGRRLPEFSGFALPLLTVMLAWGICASWWTYRPFQIGLIWHTFHLASVYLGTLSVGIGAVAGGMYLYVSRRLRHHHASSARSPFASLEALERRIISSSTLGFALLTVGLITGLILHTANASALGPGWWHSPKIVLSAAAWLVYALVMNVRYATRFRGARAAWLSIAGLLLLLAAFGTVTALRDKPAAPSADPVTGVDVSKEARR